MLKTYKEWNSLLNKCATDLGGRFETNSEEIRQAHIYPFTDSVVMKLNLNNYIEQLEAIENTPILSTDELAFKEIVTYVKSSEDAFAHLDKVQAILGQKFTQSEITAIIEIRYASSSDVRYSKKFFQDRKKPYGFLSAHLTSGPDKGIDNLKVGVNFDHTLTSEIIEANQTQFINAVKKLNKHYDVESQEGLVKFSFHPNFKSNDFSQIVDRLNLKHNLHEVSITLMDFERPSATDEKVLSKTISHHLSHVIRKLFELEMVKKIEFVVDINKQGFIGSNFNHASSLLKKKPLQVCYGQFIFNDYSHGAFLKQDSKEKDKYSLLIKSFREDFSILKAFRKDFKDWLKKNT